MCAHVGFETLFGVGSKCLGKGDAERRKAYYKARKSTSVASAWTDAPTGKAYVTLVFPSDFTIVFRLRALHLLLATAAEMLKTLLLRNPFCFPS